LILQQTARALSGTLARADACSVAKGKPVARRGRKARGLSQTAQLPTSNQQLQDKEVQ